MSKIFTSEFIARLIIEVLLIGIVVFGVQKYFESKLAPMTAEETLKREKFLNAKRDVYFQAIDILNKSLANTEFTINGVLQDTTNRNRGCKYPTELEVNSCFSKLCIYSNDKEIPLTFYRLFSTDDKSLRPIFEMSKFISLLRKDMGYGDILLDTTQDQFKFISIHRDDIK
jgi:hypothetical protein